MFDLAKLPRKISSKIKELTWSCDNIGMSGSTILLFDEMVLKIEKISRSSKNEYKLLQWLEGKLPVPQILELETQGEYSFLLMSKLSGEMTCSYDNIQNTETTVKALAKGLKMLWEVDILDCPCSNVVSEKLKQAKYRIEHNLINRDDLNPETFSTEGFSDLWNLYNYLDQNRPKQDLIFSHGDFCLPNVFMKDGEISGFIDWGTGGVADRWQDIALCVRSLKYNIMYCAGYGEEEYEKYKRLLFQELCMKPDEGKIRYYILLDELF